MKIKTYKGIPYTIESGYVYTARLTDGKRLSQNSNYDVCKKDAEFVISRSIANGYKSK